MTGPDTCQIIGRWRIVEADLWDRDYLDLVEPAYLQISDDGQAEFAFGVVHAGGEIEYAKTIVFFRWHGFDEGDEITGDGSAELRTTAPSKSSYPSTTATMRPSSLAANDFFNTLITKARRPGNIKEVQEIFKVFKDSQSHLKTVETHVAMCRCRGS